MNIDYLRGKDCNKPLLKELEVKYNMRQLIKSPTRITSHSKSIIDLIFTTVYAEVVNACDIINVHISDHMPVFINRKRKRSQHPKKRISIRLTKNYNREFFGNVILDDLRWRNFWYDNLSIDKLWDLMITIIIDSLNLICPLKLITIRDDQEDWFDGELLREIKRKDELYKIACTTQNPVDWLQLKRGKAKVKRLIIKKKRQFITKKLKEQHSAPKKFWKEIQNNLHFVREKANAGNIIMKCSNGNMVTGVDAATHLNHYYRDIGASLAESFNIKWSAFPTLVEHIGPKMEFRFIGVKEVTAIVKSLCINKSSHVENISSVHLKDALLTTKIELTYLLNKCLDTSTMPTVWKIGTITPVPKAGPSKSASDYRPISCLPLPSKIIERAVYNQIVYYLECEGLLDNRQHGFRKNHSTCTATLDFIQFLYDSLDNRKYVSCVFIDYSKAFDTIDHNILCKKLSHYGLHQNVILWCVDYLHNRKQCVNIDGIKSDLADINCGVPQGSILGPLFFIIYVNDILKLFKDGAVCITLYADDTVIYCADADPSKACNEIEAGLLYIKNWCDRNKLTINVKKTKHMLLKPRTNSPDLDQHKVKIGNTILENVKSYNYLGVVIDNSLTFSDFLKNKCNRINQCLYQLGKMRKYIDSDIACTIYKQTIVPLYDYVDYLIESGPKYYINRLDVLHEKAIGIINGKSHGIFNLKEREGHFGLHSPHMRRTEHHCSIMYGLSRMGKNLEKHRPNINLRSRNKLKFKHRHRNKEQLLKSPMCRGIKLWDRIPHPIQRSTTKVKFKQQLKKEL